jgi:hypothetical protein
MILADNILFLKHRFTSIWTQLQQLKENSAQLPFEIGLSKSGESTVIIESQGKSLYLHSKYNPREEAEQFVQKFTDVEQYKHVFFYGVGLGYQVERFLTEYPGIPFTLYEPIPELFEAFLSRVSLPKLPAQCKNLFLGTNLEQTESFLKQVVEDMHEDMLLVQLPSYQRIFGDEFQQFAKLFKEQLTQKKSSLQVNMSYEKRWVYNSLVNLEETIKTPNILLEKRDVFKDKPVIIVAAGPSLQDEIEHLKYIKEHGLAYIFSVGTSINALLVHDIHPDAACTYDPTQLNQKVFEKLNESGIADIPLIYGSSVGFEVLKYYIGPKTHMLTTQDTIAPYYLQPMNKQSMESVHDAGTISVIALQLLHLLKSNLVVLVGQNLAFRNDLLYATGAFVIRDQEKFQEANRVNSIFMESVDGTQIESNESYLLMKNQIEAALKFRPSMEVINTTQGGAKIEHTSFMSLEEVIRTRLHDRVVEPNWYQHDGHSSYDIAHAQKQAFAMKNEYEQLRKYYNQATSLFNDINRCKDHKDKNRLGQIFPKFDKLFMKITNNAFFITFLKPMNRVQEELLTKNIGKIKFENDFVAKAELIIQHFGKFMYGCQIDMGSISPIFEAIQNYIFKLNPSESRSTDG